MSKNYLYSFGPYAAHQTNVNMSTILSTDGIKINDLVSTCPKILAEFC